MPIGLIIMKWDERIGAEIVSRHPSNINVEEKTMMQLYAQHEYSGEAGFVSLTIGALNLVSYYTGPDSHFYMLLILDPDEEGMQFEDGMVEISRQVLEVKDNIETLKTLTPTFFQRISVYPKLTDEQRLGLFMQDEVKHMIFMRFREEVVISRSEIQIWLKDLYKKAVEFDMQAIMEEFVKLGLVKYASIKGAASDLVFLVQDVITLRKPPTELIRDPTEHHLPASISKLYVREVRNFFKEYKISDEDNKNVIDKILLDPQVYETLKLLRQSIITRSDMEKLIKKESKIKTGC